MVSVVNIVDTLENLDGALHHLHAVQLCRLGPKSRAIYFVGNSAVVAKVTMGGAHFAMKCYLTPPRNIAAIYGQSYYPAELTVHNDIDCSQQHLDVVLRPWIEGNTLRSHIYAGADFAALSISFDRLALTLLDSEAAHGDLKCDNIIVAEDGSMHLIDLDASFLPQFAGERSTELGTRLFQHPARREEDFDRHIDDYPIALISCALHLLEYAPSLLEIYPLADGLLFDPELLISQGGELWHRALKLAAMRGNERLYLLLEALRSDSYRIDNLRPIIAPIATTKGEIKAIQVGEQWHYVDAAGRSILRIGHCEAIRPPVAGVGYSMVNGLWRQHLLY